jgi:LysR family transcriptional regulator, glycine cleavage system transcriptional activator
MKRKLPPLKAMQSFEATARHLSFTAAAEELNVTPAAVGHQVRALEDYFGQKLLNRSTRQVEMTEEARWVLPVITQALDLLADAGTRLMATKSTPLINISVNPGFASRWLVQHMDGFHQQSPEWDVRLSTTNELVDLKKHDYDMCIRYGDGVYPGLTVHRLGEEEVSPVCAPQLLEGDRAIREPNDLRWHTLIHEDWVISNEKVWPSWRMWLQAAEAGQVDPNPGPHLPQASLAVQAAIAGQGVALSSTAMIADDLKSGKLVRPFGEYYKTRVDSGYFLVYLEEAENNLKIIAFREWLLTEYNQSS